MMRYGGLPPRRPDQYPRDTHRGLSPPPPQNAAIGRFIVVGTVNPVLVVTGPAGGAADSAIWIGPSGGDDGAQVNALFAAGYTQIHCLPGTYTAFTGVVQPPFTVVDAPLGVAIWQWKASGTCWYWHGSTETDEPYGSLTGLIIDLAGETGASIGIDFGDLIMATVAVGVRFPQNSGDILAACVNRAFFTEKCSVKLALNGNGPNASAGCTLFAALVSGSGSSGSMARTDFDLYVDQGNASNPVVVFAAGAHPYGGYLKIRGNGTGTNGVLGQNPWNSPQLNSLITIAGVVPAGHPGAGQTTKLVNMVYDVDIEGPTGFATYPLTIEEGQAGNILNGIGRLGFGITGQVFQSGIYQIGDLDFVGMTYGDLGIANSNPSSSHPAVVETSPVLSNIGTWQAGGTVLIDTGRFFEITLAANLTIDFAGRVGTAPPGQPHWVVLRIQQPPAGGPFTVTWPRPGPSGVTVLFPGGAVPAMTAAANAVDIYYLHSWDGVTYDCHFTQAMG